MTVSTVRVGVDTWMNANAATRNYGTTSLLRLWANAWEGILWFNNPAARGAVVNSAKVYLVQEAAVTGSVTINLQRYTKSWNEMTATWSNQPRTGNVAGSVVSVTKSNPAAGTIWEFDVTAIVQDVVNGSAWQGFRMWTGFAGAVKLWSLNAPGTRPYMVVDWTTAPEKPTVLRPAYGAVNLDKPRVSCDFTDHAGNTDLQSMQVQIDAANNFASGIDWDSGEVFVDGPMIDLATTSYPGLAGGATTYWRARVRDGSGLWSPWSDSVPITRYVKGTVNITSPSSGTPTVKDYTPTITWTFSATQTHWRVVLDVQKGGTWVRLHDTGKIKGTDGSYEIPADYAHGIMYETTETFRVYVQCWDDVFREATPDDPVYAQAARDFTIDYDGTITAPTSLVVSQPEVSPGTKTPWVQLTWQRSTAPDAWTIVRDGKVIAANVDPGDTIQPDGITHIFRDVGARLGVPHSWKVRAKVNNNLSTGAATATYTPAGTGIWLYDPANVNDWVLLSGKSYSGDQPDMAETYRVLGTAQVVRAVMGISGLHGDVSGGMLFTRHGKTWNAAEALLNVWKGRPNKTLRLVFGDQNIPVVVGDLTILPHPETKPDQVIKQVSFKFWQVGEFPFDGQL